MKFESTGVMTTEEIIMQHIQDFDASDEKRMMLKGEEYYKANNDINMRKMYRYEDETPVVDETKANNKLSHGFMHTLVDDKNNYLLLKPYTLECDDEKYLKELEDILGKRFQKRLSQLGYEASNKGIAWLHPYISANGDFKMLRIRSEQVIPIWVDADHEELDAVIRKYDVKTYIGKERKDVTKVEYWTAENVIYYEVRDNELILDAEKYLDEYNDYEGHFKIGGKPASWGRVPFIYFKNNDYELPDLQFVKSIIDNYDISRSDVANLLEEIKNIIYILRGYGGENLGEFVRDLAYFKAVKVDADEKAGVDTITNNINIEAAKEHYNQLKKDIFDFGQGVDKNSDQLGNSPSGIALKFIYSGLDLKCNAMEGWFKWGFEELMRFAKIYMGIKKRYISDAEVDIIFNRDIAINESQAIIDAQSSKGIISNQTIVANHPWTTSVEDELEQIAEENKSLEPPTFEDEEDEES